MDARQEQVGGDHYRGLRIQPVELTYMIGGTPAFQNVCKYICRVKEGTAKRFEDLEKAKHFVRLEAQMFSELSNTRDHYRNVNNEVLCSSVDCANIDVFVSQFPEHERGFMYRTLKAMFSRDYHSAHESISKFIDDANRYGGFARRA
jgi:hypothetical protein